MVLSSLADNGANTRSGCASDEGSFESSAEYSAEDRAARAADGRSFARTNTAAVLIEPLVVAVVSVTGIVVLSAVTALPDSSVEVLAVRVIVLLRQCGERREQERGGEEKCSPGHRIYCGQTSGHCRGLSGIGARRLLTRQTRRWRRSSVNDLGRGTRSPSRRIPRRWNVIATCISFRVSRSVPATATQPGASGEYAP